MVVGIVMVKRMVYQFDEYFYYGIQNDYYYDFKRNR